MKKLSIVNIILFGFPFLAFCFYIFLSRYSFKNFEYNNFSISSKKFLYSQGDVIEYEDLQHQYNSCLFFEAKVLNSLKRLVGQGYCNFNNNKLKIYVDSSEFRQGTYFLMLVDTKNRRKTLSKDKFKIQLIDFDEVLKK